MIDTTTEQIAELRAEIAELRSHPAIARLIGDYESRAAAHRMLVEQQARQPAKPRPAWTADSGVEPPETINRQELLSADVWNDEIPSATWASHWTARDALQRCEDGSPLFELARRALLAHWRLRHAEMQVTRARSAGDAVTAAMQLATATARTEHEHIGAELANMLPEVANALALSERWETLEHHEQVMYSGYRREADLVIAEKAMAPIEIPEIKHKKGWFR